VEKIAHDFKKMKKEDKFPEKFMVISP